MTAWMDAVHALPALTLDEVNEEAALQTRVDRKYVVRPRTWGNVLASLDGRARACSRSTAAAASGTPPRTTTRPELASYRDAARRRPHRYKVRTRHYLDTGSCAIEVKMRSSSGATAKSRQWLDADAPAGVGALPAAAAAFVGGFERIGEQAHQLTEVLTTTYERVTLVTADARVTVDRRRRRDRRPRRGTWTTATC